MASSWICLSGGWDKLKEVAKRREDQKGGFRSTRNWAKESTHLLGLLGEAVVCHVCGVKMNLGLDINGDDGYDIVLGGLTWDVKTSTYWSSPHLRENPERVGKCDGYILVAIDLKRKRGRMVGWATKAEVLAAPTRDYGYGPRHSLLPDDLNTGVPSTSGWVEFNCD